MKIKMMDGSEVDISDFSFVCEEADNAGRHFKGYADIIVDLTGNTEVSPEFRNYYVGNAFFDGDWGFENDFVDWSTSEPPLENSFNVSVGDRWNDGHGKWEGYTIHCNLGKHKIFGAINRASKEYRGIYQLFSNDCTMSTDEYEALKSLGVDLSDVSEMKNRYYVDSDFGFIHLFMNIAQSKLDQKIFYRIEDIDYDEFPASGYGLHS